MDSAKVFFICLMVIIISTIDKSNSEALPDGVTQHQYCEGCTATVKELSKSLAKFSSPSESQIMDAIEGICVPPKFVTYEYSPPKTVKVCKLLIERHEEDIEKAFGKTDTDKIDEICNKISKACEGVDRSAKPSDMSDIDLTVDGKSGKTTKQVIVDPQTGKTTIEKEEKKDVKTSDSNIKEEDATIEENKVKIEEEEKAQKKSEEKETSKPKSKKKKSKKSKKSKKGKTMSKKDKKTKRAKKDKKEAKKESKKEKKPVDDGIERLSIDVNDPSSMERVMQQIQDITKEHGKKKDKKEEL